MFIAKLAWIVFDPETKQLASVHEPDQKGELAALKQANALNGFDADTATITASASRIED